MFIALGNSESFNILQELAVENTRHLSILVQRKKRMSINK